FEGFHHEGARLRAAIEWIAQGLLKFHEVIADQARQRLVTAAADNVIIISGGQICPKIRFGIPLRRRRPSPGWGRTPPPA
ncbi:MAG: hypothetical protein AB1734_01675, partial [Elusimicrobiota bacterium]